MNSTASVAAEKVEAIKKIPLPTLETYEPDQLVAAAAAFATAALKVQEAERAITRIQAEQLEREKRIAVLQETLDSLPTEPLDVWCCIYRENLSGTLATMEVPGFWQQEPVLKTVTLDEGGTNERTVAYYERSWNIVPVVAGVPDVGRINPAEGMSDAAIAYNLAMEPGHLKWHPCWRYGILTDVGGGIVELNAHQARPEQDDEDDMSIDQAEVLSGVPIYYPPCNSNAFEAGDEVLVVFQGQSQQSPVIIGFRRQPVQCQRTWREVTIEST